MTSGKSGAGAPTTLAEPPDGAPSATEAPTAETPVVRTRSAARAATRAFRPARSVTAIVVASLLAVAALLTAAEVISRLLDRPLRLLPVDRLAQLGRETRWDDPLTFTVAGIAVGVGLLLVVLAIWPGRPRAIPLASGDPHVVIGITRGAMRRYAVQAAQTVDGVSRATATVGRRRTAVRAGSPLHDPRGLAEPVHRAVTRRIEQLAPLRAMTVRVSVGRASATRRRTLHRREQPA